MTSPAIRLDHVTKSYGSGRGVVDLQLEVLQGEVFGYLGPNGAGKTTTIRMLLDLIRPTRGRVEVLGRDPKEVELRRHIGYLPGELDLYENLTGWELLTYLDSLRGDGALDYAKSLAERLDLDPTRPIGKLSKGNKQKVGLVQAMMHRPTLLILDEPTSGLDPLVQQEVYAMLEEARAAGTTIFFSSHVLSEVERVADRVGIIREGVLVEVAPLEDLKGRAVRRFEITFAEDPPIEDVKGLDNVSEVAVQGNTVSCRVVGSVDRLIKAIATHEVVNVVSHGADLEELFLAYYRGDADAA